MRCVRGLIVAVSLFAPAVASAQIGCELPGKTEATELKKSARAAVLKNAEAISSLAEALELTPRYLPDWDEFNANFIQNDPSLTRDQRDRADEICAITNLRFREAQVAATSATTRTLATTDTILIGDDAYATEDYVGAAAAYRLAKKHADDLWADIGDERSLLECEVDAAMDDLWNILFEDNIGGPLP